MKPEPPSSSTFRPGRHLEIYDDPSHDPYHQQEKPHEPTVCTDCGAVFHEGRWQWSGAPENAHSALCAACRRIRDKQPAGYVIVEGGFALDHRDELLRLVRNLEAREKAEHPMQRIMAIDEEHSQLIVTTTDTHLARGIGEALHDAFQGKLDMHFNKDEYLVRVRWQR